MKRSLKRGGARRSNKRTRSGKKYDGNPTFTAKLGAFMLESVKGEITFSKTGGFSDKQPQVFGVLPYLHMNIKDKTFRQSLKLCKSVQHKHLSKLCNQKKLSKTLHKVNFNCNTQPSDGVKSVNNSIMDSINNRWGIRRNGRKRLREILKAQNGKLRMESFQPRV